jgi:predicted porin
MKKLLAIAVAAALVAPAAAMADTTLYGKLHASVDSVKTTTAGVTTSNTQVNNRVSRIGVKGATALDNGMDATYGLEFNVNQDGDSASMTARNHFIGLKGGFGEVRVGQHDTPAKLATAGQDIFADTAGDMGSIINVDNHRVRNAVAYINKFGPVGFAAAHSTAALGSDGVSTPTSGTTTGMNANSLMLNYSTGPWYAAIGQTSVQGQGFNNLATGTVTGAKHTNLGVGYKAEAGHAVNLVMENTKQTNGVAGKQKAVLVNGAYKMGNVTLKAQYGQAKDSGLAALTANGTEKMTTLGADYSLGKKTSVYLLHNDNKNTNRVTGAGLPSRTKTTGVGLVTQF